LPKLKIIYFGFPDESICDLDQAGYLFEIGDILVLVDGQRIVSYDELVKLVARDKYKDRQFVEVVLLPAVAGG
jgi:hypothetical protein